MSCPSVLVLARVFEDICSDPAVRIYRFWMRKPLEGFKWQRVHALTLGATA